MLLRLSVCNDIIVKSSSRIYIHSPLDHTRRSAKNIGNETVLYIYVVRGHTINFLPHRTFSQTTFSSYLFLLFLLFHSNEKVGTGFLGRRFPNALSPRDSSRAVESEREREKERKRLGPIRQESSGGIRFFETDKKRHRQERKKKEIVTEGE